jgi:polysaccharide export outer membrane protein
MPGSRALPLIAFGCLLALTRGVIAAEYLIGPQDVLAITVWNQSDLGGKFVVESNGTFTFPLVGSIQAAGLTLPQVEAELKRQLANGYFKNPQLTVTIEQYRSRRIFVLGEVRQPGSYPLSGEITLIEALARAGLAITGQVAEAIIVRARVGGVTGPLLPDGQGTTEVVRVDVQQLQTGHSAGNVMLHDGDTVFVPRQETKIYVFGEVRSPGAYPIERGLTILQALSLAGGVTERGSASRVRVIRVADDKRKESRAKLNDLVQPGDTIVVPERLF